jgi:hypothetical protein
MKIIEEDAFKKITAKISTAMNESGSDKQKDHNYAHAYSYFLSKIIPKENINFLEIGIANIDSRKSSIHGWSRIFRNSNIYAIDKDHRKMISTDKIKTFVADQGCVVQLSIFIEQLKNPNFDVILDDGSHYFSDASISFRYLFEFLKKDGVYMIEDVSKNPSTWQQNIYQWEEFLNQYENIGYEIIDCLQDRPEDDSVVIGIWKNPKIQQSDDSMS